ncbi:MAG: hypothetical protein ABIC40_03085, partial [bacterium]
MNGTNNHLNELNGSYLKRLMPFVAISLAIHVLSIAISFGIGLIFGGGTGIDVLLYPPGKAGAGGPKPPILSGFLGPERVKIFRIDFLREVIPWHAPEPIETVTPGEQPEPAEVKKPVEESKPAEEPKKIEGEVKTDENPPTDETPEPGESTYKPEIAAENPGERVNLLGPGENPPENPGNGNLPGSYGPMVPQPTLAGRNLPDESLPDAYGIFDSEENADESANVLPLPAWEFKDIYDAEWKWDNFLGNYTIYLIADISRRHGLDELFAWNWTLRQLITNPQGAFPPNVVNIATAIENPYAYTDFRIKATLDYTIKNENGFGVFIPDRDGMFPKTLGYNELPQPIVIFVDSGGFVRMVMIGRIKDIS